jgi:hypothetical protein
MSYSFDEGLRNNLNDPDLELTYTTIILSNMTLQYSRGVLHDPYILVWPFVYPIDLHIIDMYLDPCCQVILDMHFYVFHQS